MSVQKKRGTYNKTGTGKPSDQDLADDLTRLFHQAMESNPNLAVLLNWLAHAKPKVRKLLLDAFRRGKPAQKIPDDIWLDGVEGTKIDLQKARPNKKRISDRVAIVHILTTTGTRFGRSANEKFNAGSSAGKSEIRRMTDACTRARRAKKTK